MTGEIKFSSYGYAIGEHFVLQDDRPTGTIWCVYQVKSRPRGGKHQSVCVAEFNAKISARRWCAQRNEQLGFASEAP